MELQGKTAFVTGAGSGIGRAGAIIMARNGAMVVVTDRNGAAAAAVAAEITAAGGRAQAGTVDVTDDAALTAAITGTASELGLHILHSHAGIQLSGALEDVTAADMDASWQLNVRSHFVAVRAAMGPMKAARSGSIIITASNSGVQFDRGMIAYATTKHAVIAMTRQIAADYARFNVRCNALCPGFVDTPFNAGFEHQMGGRRGLENYVRNEIPLGRFAGADEIAQGILYLASDRSAFMTGHALVIDGGESL